ncbi:hypothetical protein A3L09_09230 [Thermococcus profundus]|uniref:Uncharacterized protein n=1 Tax=Thermococcus profundus TaxID=49899 RepID=A0A2Z2MD27_THEPR|nr:hypothetical protein [Thermococcus profundus]ASJ03429.1 hypothetical protein A3L09_09230 [Thermococcus profundus]
MEVPKEVFNEIDKRVKRLNALIEIAEERALSEEKRPVPKPSSPVSAYLWVSAAWVIGGLLILYLLRSRYGSVLGSASGASLMIYGVLTVGILLLIIFYYLSRRGSEEETFDLDERARAARRVVRDFYIPLREALENNDESALRRLADRLMDDPMLNRAMEVSKEGDPRVVAYALYLYTSPGAADEEEIAEAAQTVGNRVMAILLQSLLGEGKSAGDAG